MNREDGRESYASMIKTARASNYNLLRAFAEFLDNSIDAGAENICIKFYSYLGSVCKIIVTDDGDGIEDIKITATHGYSRNREESEGGEFGKGYKLAAINISEKYTILTKHKNGEYHSATWDQLYMSENDVYLPEINVISKSQFQDSYKFTEFHNSETGTTTIFESLLTTTKSAINYDEFKRYLEKRYELFIRKNLTFNIYDSNELRFSINSDNIVRYSSLNIKPITTNIKLYKQKPNANNNDDKIRFFLSGFLFEKEKRITPAPQEPSKNGNYNIGKTKFEEHFSRQKEFDSLELIANIEFNTYNLENESRLKNMNLKIPSGKIDIIRKDYFITDNPISYRAEYNDGYSNYLYHTLLYDSNTLDNFIGTNVNKQNTGAVSYKDLLLILHYVQRKHESPIIKKNKEIAKEKSNKTSILDSMCKKPKNTNSSDGNTNGNTSVGKASIDNAVENNENSIEKASGKASGNAGGVVTNDNSSEIIRPIIENPKNNKKKTINNSSSETEIKNYMEWNPQIYLGVHNCFEKGIKYDEDGKIEMKFGYTYADPKKRDEGNGCGSGFRRINTVFINTEACKKMKDKILLEVELYKAISGNDNIKWCDNSKERFKVNKESIYNIVELFNNVVEKYKLI